MVGIRHRKDFAEKGGCDVGMVSKGFCNLLYYGRSGTTEKSERLSEIHRDLYLGPRSGLSRRDNCSHLRSSVGCRS